MLPNNFSDYIVYVDESGDHSLASINQQFPLFALVFCIFRVERYIRDIVPAAQQVKFEFFGHDQIILHEIDIRGHNPPFGLLQHEGIRERFLGRLSDLVEHAEMTVIAAVIDKQRMVDAHAGADDPYNLALRSCMERLQMLLHDAGASEQTTQIVFESRGASEDRRLRTTFGEVRQGSNAVGVMPNLRYQFVSKRANSTGLQFADLIARPIALHTLRPGQRNRAYDVIAPKLWRDANGNVDGYGLKVFP